MANKVALGIYSYADDVVKSIHELDLAGFNSMITYSPIPVHDIEHALEEVRPKFKWNKQYIIDAIKRRNFHLHRFSITGAFVGIGAAFVLVLGTTALWPLHQGGQPLIFAFPQLGLLSYEMMTLFAAVFSILGLLWLSKLPFYGNNVYDVRLAEDKFGIALTTKNAKELKKVTEIMKNNGAEEIIEQERVLRD